jgi:hypothetical protein
MLWWIGLVNWYSKRKGCLCIDRKGACQTSIWRALIFVQARLKSIWWQHKRRRHDIVVNYWVNNPLLAAEDELITRLRGGKQITGSECLLLEGPAIPMCFLADHWHVAWRAGLTIMGNKADGQGGPVKLAHLLWKDSYRILEKTKNLDLQKAFNLLQASFLLVDGTVKVKEYILVPRSAFYRCFVTTNPRIFHGTTQGHSMINWAWWRTCLQDWRILQIAQWK